MDEVAMTRKSRGRRRSVRAACSLAMLLYATSHTLSAGQTVRDGAPAAVDAHAVISRYCATCHNGRLKTAGLVLDTLNLDTLPADAEIWEKVLRKLRMGAMPPVGA